MRPLKAILFLLFTIALQPARATEPFCFDTTAVAAAPAADVPLAADTAVVAKPKKKSLFNRFLAYFNDANKEKKKDRKSVV